uniref:Uncharacterized protein n=1 Tax=Anguilla anguilla TaxID=7936 RepID=A0A0E9XN96_ANGAN
MITVVIMLTLPSGCCNMKSLKM